MKANQLALAIIFLITAIVVVTLISAAWGVKESLFDWKLKEPFTLTQLFLTSLAIVIAGFIAVAKWDLFRDFEPHLTISHEINHRRVGESSVHIDIAVKLHNSSRVKVRLGEGQILLKQISPMESDFNADIPNPFVQWPDIEEFRCTELSIEPGQTLQETVEFIIADDMLTVAVHSFFPVAYSKKQPRPGWGVTTIYDIVRPL